MAFTVLAVDDHLPNLLVLEALLAELSINVVTVNSGFDAIEYITTHQSQKRYRRGFDFYGHSNAKNVRQWNRHPNP